MRAAEARELTRHYPPEVVARVLDQAGPLSPDTLTLLRGAGFAEVAEERDRTSEVAS